MVDTHYVLVAHLSGGLWHLSYDRLWEKGQPVESVCGKSVGIWEKPTWHWKPASPKTLSRDLVTGRLCLECVEARKESFARGGW